jgi:coenzyme PQQ precursor peptide PqqA
MAAAALCMQHTGAAPVRRLSIFAGQMPRPMPAWNLDAPPPSLRANSRAEECCMAWETPVVTEIEIGMEVTAYLSAEDDDSID